MRTIFRITPQYTITLQKWSLSHWFTESIQHPGESIAQIFSKILKKQMAACEWTSNKDISIYIWSYKYVWLCVPQRYAYNWTSEYIYYMYCISGGQCIHYVQ